MPDWAKAMSRSDATQAYLAYHRATIEHLKDEPLIESWQLENEFWLRSFGINFNYSRRRLKQEFAVLRELDPNRPIIMSTAQIISLPLRKPTPDIYATSVYRNIYNSKKHSYTTTWAAPKIYTIKRILIKAIKHRDLIIHELQTEPWGPKANWEMSIKEQDKSMNADEIYDAVSYAKATGISHMDLWGAEWWYWRDDKSINTTIQKLLK